MYLLPLTARLSLSSRSFNLSCRSWYFSYFPVSFCSTYLREQLYPQWLFPLRSFSELQCLASCGGFHGLFGWKSPTTILLPHSLLHFWGNAHTIILSLHSNPYSLHASQCMNRLTNSFYIVCLSLDQFPKICCTVSSWLPHILHLDDTFSFTAFVLGAWSWAAKLSPSVSSFSSPVHIQFQETSHRSSVSFLICPCSCFPDQSSVRFLFTLSSGVDPE